MLSGVLVTLGILVIVAGVLGAVCWLWVRGSNEYIGQRVRIELERRSAEQQIHQMTFAAMKAMVNEARTSRS